MSDHKSVKDLPKGGEQFDSSKAGPLKMIFGAVGGICLVATLIILFAGSETLAGAAAYSYLFAVTFFFTLAIGGLFWTMLHNATNSGWGTVVRRQMENIAGMVPWVFGLMIPLLFPSVRDYLWEWEPELRDMKVAVAEEMKHGAVEEKIAKFDEEVIKPVTDQLTRVGIAAQASDGGEGWKPGETAAVQTQLDVLDKEFKRLAALTPTEDSVYKDLMHHQNYLLAHKYFGYFNWAYLRLFICAFFLILFTVLLRYWSIRADTTEPLVNFQRARYWSSGMIFFFGVSFTFIVVDLLMTMNYEWFSTMWGVYLFAGAALNSMAVLIIVITWLRSKGYLQQVVSMEHYHTMGKLLFAFTVFWAYIAFSQYFLIWYANITEETRFYLLRNSDGWHIVSICLVAGHFLTPFVALLFQPLKKRPHVLAFVACWTLLMHVLDIYWIVIAERGPSLSVGGHPQLWIGNAIFLDALAFVGVAGVLAAIFIHNLKRSSLYPCGDPRLEESVNLVN